MTGDTGSYTQNVIALRFLAAALLVPALVAQDAPRSKASDYPVHTSLPAFELAAEYLVHSIPTEQGMYFTNDYLVVEVAFFPSTRDGLVAAANSFQLRVNDGKWITGTQSPGMVAASLKYPDWTPRSTASAGAGSGPGAVILGAPVPVGRFPDDPNARQPRPLPRAPDDPAGGTVQPEQPKSIGELIARAALPEGPSVRSVKGCLFFPLRGKLKSIRSLELVYEGPAGAKASLKLL